MDFEIAILDFIQKLRTDWLDYAMKFITSLLDNGTVWVFLALCMLPFRKTRKCGFIMLISMLICHLIGTEFLKPLIKRTRPCNVNFSIKMLIMRPGDYSFPSGHAGNSFAAAVCIYLHFKDFGKVAFVMAGLIAFSRMYLYVHFPTDIIFGAILGTLCSLLIFYGYEYIKKTYKRVRQKK